MNFLQPVSAAFFGWFCAYLVNYLADVFPFNRKFVKPLCIRCQETVSVKNYLLFAPCPHCQSHRSIRTWIVQVLMVIISVWFSLFSPENTGYWISMLLMTYFMVVAVIDYEYRVVLIQIAIGGAVLALPIGVYLHGIAPTLLGALAGFGITAIFYLLGLGFSKILNKLMKKDKAEIAYGFGDVYLSAILGLILGWPGVVAGIILGTVLFSLVGGIYLLFLLIARKYKFITVLPMAPFLIFGSALLLFRSAFGL